MNRTLALAAVALLGGLMLSAADASAQTLTYGSVGITASYTESGYRHRNFYNSYSNAGHWHGNGFIYGHSGCCSNLGRIDRPDGQTFTWSSIQRANSGTSTWTAYNAAGVSIGSVTISGSSGTYTFPATWTGLSRIDITFSSGSFGWDNANASVCTAPTSVEAGGPYNVNEGSSVTVTGSGSGGTVFNWDLDSGTGTGPYNDASGTSATYSAAGVNGTSTQLIGLQHSCGAVHLTDTAIVNVANVAPTVNASIPGSGTEGTAVSFSVTASDPGPDTLTYSWSFGDGATSTQQNPTHIYSDDGTYTVTVTVSDGETTTSSTSNISIVNANPTASISGPSTGVEGTALSFTGSATDPGAGDTFTYAWTFGDGGTATGANVSHTWADEGTGSYTVSLTATDDDGGTNTTTHVVTIANVPPVIGTPTATSEDEGTPVSFTITSTDVGVNDTVTYAWNFGDNTTGTGAAPTHAYADDGTYTASVVATDNDGGVSGTATVTVTISNVAPTVSSISGPTTGDEGSTLTFAAAGSDPGSVDQANLIFNWAWGDATAAGTGASASHAWADDNPGSPYTITVTTTDPQGATGTDTYTVVINNVAPTITTNPGLFGDEGVLYTYQANAFDPGADTLVYSLSPSSPASATVDATGLVSWTPDFTEVGPNTFTITVDDGDGGTDVQTWTVIVGFVDNDNDGMADTWETANGLDPTVDDSALDPDGDCVSNLDEFLNGQDPNVSDVPGIPALTTPADGGEVDDPRPDLGWDAATDPNGDALTYEVELYEDQAMTTLLTTAAGVDALTWQVDINLTLENWDYWWRVRANDGWCDGQWSDLDSFFLNEFNEPPGPPTALFPIDGETIGTLTPAPEMDEGVDPDRDGVGHHVRVWDADGTNLLTQGWIPIGGRSVSWAIDITLEEDTWYMWDAQAEDEHGLLSDWIEAEPFFATSQNAPPLDVRWIDPADGEYVEGVSPDLVVTESSDPEGRDIDYEYELDTASGFDSGDFLGGVVAHTGTGTVTWDLEADGIALTEDTWWNARVRAVDQEGGTSAWDTIRFFVRGDNNPPPTPALISPADGSVLTELTPSLAIGHVEDPEEDIVFYEIMVARDAELTNVIGSVDGLTGSAGPDGTADQTSWRTDVNLVGEVYWTARAVDERGAASDWADPFLLTLDTDELEGPQPDDILTGGCACEDSEASIADADSPAGLLAIALMLLVPAIRRRR